MTDFGFPGAYLTQQAVGNEPYVISVIEMKHQI
jgi:hypothetical protein